MKKLLVAIAIVGFCTDAGALISGDTLQGVASIINATKNNNYQQGYQNGVQQWGFAQQQGGFIPQSASFPKEQTKINLRNQGYIIGDDDVVANGNGQVQGYVSNEGWVVNPDGVVIYGPANKINNKVSVPKKIKNAFKKRGYVYQNTNQNVSNQQQGFVMANGGQQWVASNITSQPVLNNGMPADSKSISRFLKNIEEMAEDLFSLLEANIENEKVRSLALKLIKLMMQSCTQQTADRSKLMKMRDSILELAKKADATSVAEKFDTIVKSTFKDNDLLVSDEVEEREAERKKKLKRKKREEEEGGSNKRGRTDDDYYDSGYETVDGYESDYY